MHQNLADINGCSSKCPNCHPGNRKYLGETHVRSPRLKQKVPVAPQNGPQSNKNILVIKPQKLPLNFISHGYLQWTVRQSVIQTCALEDSLCGRCHGDGSCSDELPPVHPEGFPQNPTDSQIQVKSTIL